ncbi:hypothetical protein [Burkholderia cenocepacia]|uniref:hypothetical protein n=2 Tax=Burkholderiaceae TaxID=119060 RepID=UPI0020133D0F|nr:hypothetical protein [Burkholderia cenocepacia]MDP9548789.1 hypothetical protein [Burkholderia cepacia]MDP9626965.1 hypothetical protein [Burkholderia cepacia]MDP9672915.1 hypothetical protein [Burkholderia cepacia]
MTMSKERPIQFSGPMVRAVLEGRKTQTRRAMTPQPFFDDRGLLWWHWSKHAGSACDQPVGAPSDAWLARSPYGVPGDHLWVRETFVAYGRWETRFSAKKGRDEWHFVDMTLETGREYRFDSAAPNAKRGCATPAWWRRPSIFMPRAAARITLEIAGVRVERLQSINEADAIAEGVEPYAIYGGKIVSWKGAPDMLAAHETARDAYCDLWNAINAERGYGWDANPWVWVLEFKRIGV